MLANDSAQCGIDPITLFVLLPGPANGTTFEDFLTGEITYTPNLNFNGIDTFTYQVCDFSSSCDTATVTVTVNPVNDPPVAVPDTASTAEDSAEIIGVLFNDTDPDGDPLTVISAGPALSGTVTIDPSYTIAYNPNANINGTDVFTYTISDGVLTDTTTVTVTIIPINDPPIAFPDSYTTTTGITLTVATPGVLANDTDVDIGDTLSVITSTVTAPMSGTLTINADGSFTYVQTPPFVGVDSFTYQAEDAIGSPSNVSTVTITVIP